MLQNPERTALRQYQIIQPIQLVAEIYPMAPALTCKTRPAPSREEHPERWPSGLRRTLGKRVCGKPYRGFESHSLRQIVRRAVISLAIKPNFHSHFPFHPLDCWLTVLLHHSPKGPFLSEPLDSTS